MKFDYRCLEYLLSCQLPRDNFPLKGLFDNDGFLEVEIGFGLGEVLVQNAKNNPNRNIIGIEQNWERICKCLKTAVRLNEKGHSLKNLKVLKADAKQAFKWYFKERSVHYIYCLFPCPWPKKGHIENRLFSAQFLSLLNNRLVDEGQLRIVTDYYPYAQWIKEQVIGTGFKLEEKRVDPQYNTKFEKKWVSEGQKEFFEVLFLKKEHKIVEEKEKVEMKAYRLDDFNPEQFVLPDWKEDISVINKEIITDQKQNKVLIHLVVSESELSQHFWALITKDKGYWQICKMSGQAFFPTPGIAKALEHVYNCASNKN